MTFVGLENIRTMYVGFMHSNSSMHCVDACMHVCSTLSGNPLDCSCAARYLYDFLLREDLSGPTCEEPEQFRARELLSLEMDEFCGECNTVDSL